MAEAATSAATGPEGPGSPAGTTGTGSTAGTAGTGSTAGTVTIARLESTALDVAAHLAAAAHPRAGAVATFVGQVRDHDPEASGEVVRLDYTAHPDAAAVLQRIAAEVAATPTADGDGVLALAVSHRVGELGVGEPAIVACVATAHRDLAFRLCRELVERVKAELPVWKRQVVADGSHTWVGIS